MKDYCYKEIQLLNETGVYFKDGKAISFLECRKNWANSRNISIDESFCVAERNINAEVPYFRFYDNEGTKVLFHKAKCHFISKYRKSFLKFQIDLNRVGYSTYDCS